ILNPNLEVEDREERAAGVLAAFGLSGTVRVADVLQIVDVYRAVVMEQFAPVSQQVEVPFTHVNEAGQQISGYIDHLLETADGPVILDHKIFPGRREAWEAKALSYSGQLAIYAQVLGSEKPVRTVIHLVTAGVLVEV
ncbi:MAG: PD-(D/E)XK nuclease family protein, partial [Verrucomicrobiales bacterium]|nr:PD-(D/E)XK nuclease family protein [Verrucomicrobiales bacterium]